MLYRSISIAGCFVASILALGGGFAVCSERPSVKITFTEHGIPHVEAEDYFGLGYGYAYAAAKLDVCALAGVFLEASGKRSAAVGSDLNDGPSRKRSTSNEVSDFATTLLLDDEQIAMQRAGLTPETHALVDGYAAGFDRYLADTPRDQFPKTCRSAGWVRAISPDDILRRIAGIVLLTGSFDQELFDAHPPTGAMAPAAAASSEPSPPSRAGSNAFAFGAERTNTRKGLLLGNPHWFWGGTNRFMEAHLTIHGKYDVMGVSVIGTPLITLGFNRSMAWTHTVAKDARGTVFALKLDPSDPTRYLIDGRSVPMQRKTVTIEVRRKDGTLEPVKHDFWLTMYGPVVESAQLPWTNTTAYSLADAANGNQRYLRQLLEIGTASDVHVLKARLERTMGLVWVNTLAADSYGDALYADFTVVPNVPKDLYQDCTKTVQFSQAVLVNVMDGSRSACQWRDDPRAPQRHILPAEEKPSLLTRDYVENSNSSHWFVTHGRPLEGFSPIIGKEGTPPNLRTRFAHSQVKYRELGGDKWDMSRLDSVLFSNRDYLAELVLDDLLVACATSPEIALSDGHTRNLKQACSVLERWDRKDELNSVGAQVFREFAREEKPPGEEDPATAKSFWRFPFDANSPVETPRGLDTTTTAPLQALARAVERLESAGIPLDAPLGDIQFIERSGKRIPLHGGLIFNRISLTLKAGVGYTEPMGTADSYIQVVTFDEHGPVADILLVDSQSGDSDSPWFADQAELYSRKKWVRAPFTRAEIASHKIAPTIVLSYAPRSRK